jgi:hypothetical protein
MGILMQLNVIYIEIVACYPLQLIACIGIQCHYGQRKLKSYELQPLKQSNYNY